MVRIALALVALPLLTGAALAGGSECDCGRRVGLCQAEAVSDGTKISFTSQTEQCSRISFLLGDETASITIRHGRGSAAFGGAAPPKGVVPVAGCYVCDVAATR